MHRWLQVDTRRRRLLLAAAIYVTCICVFLLVAPRSLLVEHTRYNHYALLAEAWLDGRFSLAGAPPAYAGMNDFALHEGRWYIVFPPFPALLLLPLVAFAGHAELVRDGQFFLWIAGLGPAVLFLALERLRALGLSTLGERGNLLLSLLFACGSVYFFIAVQGTVWYAAHVVAVVLAAGYVLVALAATHPVLAGSLLALAFLTRPPLILASAFFVFEAIRCSRKATGSWAWPKCPSELGGFIVRFAQDLDKARLSRRLLLFAFPLIVAVGLGLLYNELRFGSPLDAGYAKLRVVWQARMQEWGLFDYHYLPRNLGVILTALPWPTPDAQLPFKINLHGLALWFTSPLYIWLLWPRRRSPLHVGLWATVGLVALPTLLYQNTGWVQFGYRFSTDYAVFLFCLLAIGGYRFGWLFRIAAIWAIAINAFGAVTFGKARYAEFYDQTSRSFYQPD